MFGLVFKAIFKARNGPFTVNKNLLFYGCMHLLSNLNKQSYWANEYTLYRLPIAGLGLWK